MKPLVLEIRFLRQSDEQGKQRGPDGVSVRLGVAVSGQLVPTNIPYTFTGRSCSKGPHLHKFLRNVETP